MGVGVGVVQVAIVVWRAGGGKLVVGHMARFHTLGALLSLVFFKVSFVARTVC